MDHHLLMTGSLRKIQSLTEILENVSAATSRYGTRDDVGHSMDTLKIIEGPEGNYLGVYHVFTGTRFTVRVATSVDLLEWQHRGVLDDDASQPTIAALPTGGFLVALEAGGAGRPSWLRLRHYAGLSELLAADADRTVNIPHTLVPDGRLAEGTPSIHSAVLRPDLDRSVIDIGFHYFRDGDVDRQARGRLTDFRRWEARRQRHLDSAVESCGVSGNIGDRDHVRWQGRELDVIEGQLRKGDWSSWRVFLYDRSARSANPLQVRTHGGSTAFGNPTVRQLRSPAGAAAVAVTLFVFSEGAAPGEPGELVYYRELPDDSSASEASGW
jgi:hypothetical protein